MTLHLFDHLLVLVLVAMVPLEGIHAFRSLRARLERGDPDARVVSYRRGLVLLWGLAGILAAGWIALGREAAALGVAAPDGLLSWGLLAAALGASAYQLLAVRRLGDRPEELAQVTSQLEALRPLLPRDDRELGWFAALGVTAGISEELLYRGFLIAYLSVWVGLWPAVVLSSVVFGVGHVYQGGASAALRTGLVGLVLGVVYALAGQIWAPMVLHAAVDLASGWAARQALGAEQAGGGARSPGDHDGPPGTGS